MITMSSLEAQNQFGLLIDSSQREPVTITRRGRPVAVVVSYQDFQKESQAIGYQAAKYISNNYPLRGQVAADALRQSLSEMPQYAEQEGLTEADIARMADE
jgi:antitoxin Phd